MAAARISPLEHVARIPPGIPVLLLAGTADQHTRLAEIEAMRARIGPAARLVVIEGATHAMLRSADRALYDRSVLALLVEL